MSYLVPLKGKVSRLITTVEFREKNRLSTVYENFDYFYLLKFSLKFMTVK